MKITSHYAAVRAVTLGGATLTVGLMAGVFYAYSVSVNLGLLQQPDESYVSTMQQINERIQNPLFSASFFGAILFLLAATAAHFPRPQTRRFWLVASACALYMAGGFMVTVLANVPLNEALARVSLDAPTDELARARSVYEGAWNFWNGVRAVFSFLAFAALVGACLMRERPR